MPDIEVRFYAGAAAAAGVDHAEINATSVDDALKSLKSQFGDRLARVLDVAAILVDGQQVHDRTKPLTDNTTVEILPPYAGG